MTLGEVITKGRRRGKPMKAMSTCVARPPARLLLIAAPRRIRYIAPVTHTHTHPNASSHRSAAGR
eukprot:COSAG01_NODE_49581_length_371_cov_0.566176_1_plen_64_part_01